MNASGVISYGEVIQFNYDAKLLAVLLVNIPVYANWYAKQCQKVMRRNDGWCIGYFLDDVLEN